MTNRWLPPLIRRPVDDADRQRERIETRRDQEYLAERQRRINARIEALRINAEVQARHYTQQEGR